MSFTITALRAIFTSLFVGLWESLFPAKTAAEEKSDTLQKEIRTKEAMDLAAEASPEAKEDLETLLSKGRL